MAIAVALLVQTACSGSSSNPSAVDGVLDLRGWSFDVDGLVQLQGAWEFCWGELLEPGAAGFDSPACGTLDVPGLWTDDGAVPGLGYATYRLRVLLPADRSAPLALSAGAPLTAHRLWIDGREVPGTGRVTLEPGRHVSQLHNRLHALPNTGDELRLVIQVENFDFRSGGLRRRWILGDDAAVRSWVNALTIRDSTLTTVNIIVGLFFLAFFAIRPKEAARLYFGLGCLAFALRVLPGTYSDLRQLVAPDMMFPTVLRFEYFINNFMVFAAIGYFQQKVPGYIHARTSQWIRLGAVAGMLAALFLPLSLSQIPMRSAWILGTAALVTSFVGLLTAARRGEPNVRITLGAVPLILTVVLWDSLRAEGAMASPVELLPNSMLLMVLTEANALFPLTMLMMVLIEATVLLRTFSRSYDRIEDLSKSLEASNKDLRDTNRAVIRFVPFDFLRLLKKDSIRDLKRGDCLEADMSIMFCDIRGFTTLIESLSPDSAFRFVNSFTEEMEPAIHENGGFINQYLGDCIMALFPAGSDAAMRAGLGMLKALEGFNEADRERMGGNKPTRIGIGINSGPLMIGTIGGPERLAQTVIGDAVNTAARVESLTKLYGTRFLISGTTYDGLTDPAAYRLRLLDRVIVQGRTESIPIYEVLDGLSEEERNAKLATSERFAEARRAYDKGAFATAGELFGACLARCPTDRASDLYVERCRKFAADGVPPGWRGETVLTEK